MEISLHKGIIDNAQLGYVFLKKTYNSEKDAVDYKFIEVNSFFEKYTGLLSVNCIGKTILDVLPIIKENDFNWIEIYEKLSSTATIKKFNTSLKTSKSHYAIEIYSPEKDYFIIVLKDISNEIINRTENEEKIEYFKQMFNKMNSGVGIYKVINDGEYGRDYIIQDFNKESLRIEEKTEDQVVGKSLYDLRPNIDEYGLIDVFRDVWKTGISKQFPLKKYTDGKYDNYYDNYVFKLSANVIVSIYNDVTEGMNNQEKLIESEEKYHSIFDKAPVGICITSLKSKILHANKKFCQIVGFSLKKLKKLKFEDFTHPEDIKKSTDLLLSLAYGEKIKISNEKRYIRKDGKISVVKYSATMVNDIKGFPLHILIILEDITKIKELEKENLIMESQLRNQQKLEAMGTLAGGVAHEINNPINGIMNYGQLIFDINDKNSETAQYATEIIHETNRVSNIVRNLLQFSRQENEGHSETQIEDIINKTLSLINNIINKDQIKFEVNIPDNLPNIKCRSQQIQQVLMNLFTNARDALNNKYKGYHDNKIMKLTCELIVHKNKKWIKITIEDHGNGISKSIKGKIFDPFFTTKSRDKGTGLGLAISYGIVKDHGGDLVFESEESKFTKAHLMLPC